MRFRARRWLGTSATGRKVRATYAPPGWGGLVVRASWSAALGDAVDLEIQLSASSVGELDGVEVGVVSRLDRAADEEAAAALLVEAHEPAGPVSDVRGAGTCTSSRRAARCGRAFTLCLGAQMSVFIWRWRIRMTWPGGSPLIRPRRARRRCRGDSCVMVSLGCRSKRG